MDTPDKTSQSPSKEIRDLLSDTESQIIYKDASWDQPKYTFENPHTCRHCQQVVLSEVGLRSQPLHDGSVYTRVIVNGDDNVNLPYGLHEAAKASKEGCHLYEWLLDFLARDWNQSDSWQKGIPLPWAKVTFLLYFNDNHDMPDYIPCVLGFSLQGDFGIIDGRGQGMRLCARPDNIASSLISIRPNEEDVMSSRSRSFAKNCFLKCLAHHEQCRVAWLRNDLTQLRPASSYPIGSQLPHEETAISKSPTRLLELRGGNSPQVRVVEVESLGPDAVQRLKLDGYAILSYCWGPSGNPVHLTTATRSILQSGMLASKLPKTIRDAISYTLSLGLTYLWIDALCIFQDSDQDKALEIKRMGSYYTTAAITISVASASGTSEGAESRRGSSIHSIGPWQLTCRVGDQDGQILMSPSPLEKEEPITKRAWTMQESLLSRRMLIFSDQLYWCCASSVAECEGPNQEMALHSNRFLGEPRSLVAGIFPAHVLRDWPAERQWLYIVSEYSKRNLGFGGDKLLAISAFAKHVHLRFRVQLKQEVEYVAGQFLSLEHLELTMKSLSWTSRDPSRSRRVKDYRAPSWSWASLDGRILVDPPRLEPTYDRKYSASFLSHHVELGHPEAPYGSVKSASLRLRGTILTPRDVIWLPIQISNGNGNDEYFRHGLILQPDAQDDQECVNEAAAGDSSYIYLCSIIEDHGEDQWGKGFLLRQVPGAPQSFRRVGVFELKFYCLSDEGKRLHMVTAAEQQEITLI